MDQPPSPRSPLSPVVAPRGERRARFLGPILAALLLVLVVGGAAFAVDKARDGDDNRDAADATATARTLALASSPVATGVPSGSTPAEETEVVETPATEAEEAPPPTATTEPTQAQAPASAAEQASPTRRAATTEPTRSTSLRAPDYLPDLDDLPDGFEQTADDKYSKDEMIGQLGDNGAGLVEEWQWRENAYRWFAIPEASEPDPESISALTVSVHRFKARAGATDAIDGLAEIVLTADPTYEEVDVEKIGDEARALVSEEGGNTYVLYVRTANFVIRFGGYSAAGDPSETVIDLAKKLVEG